MIKLVIIFIYFRYTALHHAAQQGHINIVNLLLEHKADANATTNVRNIIGFLVLYGLSGKIILRRIVEWTNSARHSAKVGLCHGDGHIERRFESIAGKSTER